MRSDHDDGFDGLDSVSRDAERLIQEFGINVADVSACKYGSERYRRIYDAYERLARCQQRQQVAWDRAQVDGKTGVYLKNRLWAFKRRLQKIGEGPPTRVVPRSD